MPHSGPLKFRPPTACSCGNHYFAPTSRWGVALVSPRDEPLLSRYVWTLNVVNGGTSVYAYSTRFERETGWRYLHHGVLPPMPMTDHRDGNGLDCRRSNLRTATSTENMRNRQRANKNNKTGVKGVYLADNRFVAQITINRRAVVLGRFKSLSDAAAAYDAAATKYFGEFARLNKQAVTREQP